MRRLVLLLMLLALPLSWPWAVAAQAACCAGDLPGAETANGTAAAPHDSGVTPCVQGCDGCATEHAPCAADCSCQGHTQTPGTLHQGLAPLALLPAEPGATPHAGAVPEPFAATPLRPPSAPRG